MAKNLLWLFVVINFLSFILLYFAEAETSFRDELPMWVAIGILAICESIEKSKGIK